MDASPDIDRQIPLQYHTLSITSMFIKVGLEANLLFIILESVFLFTVLLLLKTHRCWQMTISGSGALLGGGDSLWNYIENFCSEDF